MAESRKHRQLDLEAIQNKKYKVRKDFSKLVFFVYMLTTTTVCACAFHTVYLYYFHMFVRDLFAASDSHHSFKSIVNNTDWWEYMEAIISHNFYHMEKNKTHGIDRSATDKADKKIHRSFWLDNILIGRPKLRQIRVAKNTCFVHFIFNRYFNDCYAGYEPSREYRNHTFKGVPYLNHEEYPVKPLKGVMATYVGPGYVQFLTDNSQKNIDILKNLRKKKWVDRGTRLLILELAIFNRNLNVFSNIQLYVEKIPTGDLLKGRNIRMLPVYYIWHGDLLTVIIVGLTYIAIIYATSKTIWTLIRSGVYAFITKGMNLLTLLYLISSYTNIAFGLIQMIETDSLLNSLKTYSEDIFIEPFCYRYDVMKVLSAIGAVACWLMLFKFISINKTMRNFSLALQKGYHDILGFSIMFMIVFISFAALGLLLFSKSNPAFSNLTAALVTMMRMVMTDFQYAYLEKGDPVFGPLYFIAFILFVFFVLLNTFLAVIGDSYVETREEDHVGFGIIKAYLKYILEYIFPCCKRIKTCKLLKRFGKKRHPSKTLPPQLPRVVNEEEALNEFFGKSTHVQFEKTFTDAEEKNNQKDLLLQTKEKSDRLSKKVEKLEQDTEVFVGRIDRILGLLEIMASERLTATFNDEEDNKSEQV